MKMNQTTTAGAGPWQKFVRGFLGYLNSASIVSYTRPYGLSVVRLHRLR